MSQVEQNGAAQQLVVVGADSAGHTTAHVLGAPELQASAARRDEALQQLRALLADRVTSGALAVVEVPQPNPLLSFTSHLDPNDPLESEFVEELARRRQEDLARRLQEDEPQCPSSSSTPTT